MGVGDQIFSGTATFGRWYAFFGAVVGTIIGIIAFGFGVYYLLNPTQAIQGTAQSASVPVKQGNMITYTTVIYWVIGGTKYSQALSSVNAYQMGDHMTVYYIPSDPGHGALQSDEFWGLTLTIGSV